MLTISVFGVHRCYAINSSGDNKDFILRVMCIGLPVMIRVLAVTIPVFIAGGILETVFLYPESIDEETVQSTPIQIALVSAFMAGYHWYLSTKIKAVSSGNA